MRHSFACPFTLMQIALAASLLTACGGGDTGSSTTVPVVDAAAEATPDSAPVDAAVEAKADTAPEAASCAMGKTMCADECVDTTKDPANCGGCGTACAAGQVCSNGACALSCQQGLTDCSGTCSNLQTDNANCGTCGTACPVGQVCSSGACALSCQEGLTDCAGTCVKLSSDNANCGTCGTACAAGQVCSNGTCAVSCQQGLTNCTDVCVNLKSDNANCGTCGTACLSGQVCSNGACALSCQQGLTNCSGMCVKLSSDNANCGACGKVCVAGQVCSGSTCALSCQQGLTNCDGTCVKLSSDNANCGACDNACGSGQVCSGGTCALSCQADLTDCDGTCVNLDSDPANCGACGSACAAGHLCVAGECAPSCQAPLLACSQVCVDPRFDPMNCNGCGNACTPPAGSVALCSYGVCTSQCSAGFGDCDGSSANGCETDLGANVAHCGGCDKSCGAVSNGTPGCTDGACVVGSCDAGFGDCDDSAANGCEVPLASTAEHCGACDNACPAATPNCIQGTCKAIDTTGVFAQYDSEGRTVYIFKSAKCADLASSTGFCGSRGMAWWSPKSQSDANQLVSYAYGLDSWHTWIQVYGLTTTLGTINGYTVTVDDTSCVAGSSSGFAAFRKWACSFCDPEVDGNVSCCWDTDHAYDWFVCEA